jgi:hypothetical protein
MITAKTLRPGADGWREREARLNQFPSSTGWMVNPCESWNEGWNEGNS